MQILDLMSRMRNSPDVSDKDLDSLVKRLYLPTSLKMAEHFFLAAKIEPLSAFTSRFPPAQQAYVLQVVEEDLPFVLVVSPLPMPAPAPVPTTLLGRLRQNRQNVLTRQATERHRRRQNGTADNRER
jgi:hypothetical protein